MANKLKVKESVVKWSGSELDGKLPEIIAKLQKLIDDNPNLFDFEIECETESGWYDSCSTEITIDAYRWETNEELASRIHNAAVKKEQERVNAIRQAEANEKRERSLYESLKRKFDKEIEESSKKPNQ